MGYSNPTRKLSPRKLFAKIKNHCGAAGDPTSQAVGGGDDSLWGLFGLQWAAPSRGVFEAGVIPAASRGGKRFGHGGLDACRPRLPQLGAVFCELCGSPDFQGTGASPVPPQLYVNYGSIQQEVSVPVVASVGPEVQWRGSRIGQDRLVEGGFHSYCFIGQGVAVVWSLSVPWPLCGLVPRAGSGLPSSRSGFEASLRGPQQAVTQEEATSGDDLGAVESTWRAGLPVWGRLHLLACLCSLQRGSPRVGVPKAAPQTSHLKHRSIQNNTEQFRA